MLHSNREQWPAFEGQSASRCPRSGIKTVRTSLSTQPGHQGGEKVAIVGETVSGKSTLVNLRPLLRTDGRALLVDGVDYRERPLLGCMPTSAMSAGTAPVQRIGP